MHSTSTSSSSIDPVDSLLDTCDFTSLVGRDLSRTPSEADYAKHQKFLDLLLQHQHDPLLSTVVDLRQLLFTPCCHNPTPEEDTLPHILQHKSAHTSAQAFALKTWHRVLHKDLDPRKLRPFLGFRPAEIVRKTLENTTQLARMIIRHPLRKHIKARFPFLNGKRINEGISTDRLYANCPDILSGFTSAHVFYGMHSTNIQVYGHTPGGDGLYNCYREFCRDHGVPSALRRDNAGEGHNGKLIDFNREFLVKDEFSEPYNQQQNVVESGGIRWLKSAIHVLLDMTGAPP